MVGIFFLINCCSKITDFASKRISGWSTNILHFFHMELNPFLNCASTLSSRNKGCISFLLLLDLELANVIQDFRSALTLKSPLISTVDFVIIMTSTLLLMCQSLLWHFHASSAFSVTFWTACNSSKSEIFRNKSFRLSNLKISITRVSRNINS